GGERGQQRGLSALPVRTASDDFFHCTDIEERLSGIDTFDSGAQGGCELFGSAGCANSHSECEHSGWWREVHRAYRFAAEILHPYITDDTNDGKYGPTSKSDLTVQGIRSVGPQHRYELFTQNDRRQLPITRGEEPTALQRDSHRPQVI